MPVLVLVLTGSNCYNDAEIDAGALGSFETTLGSAPTPTTTATITATTSVSATTSTSPPQERSSSNTSYDVDASGQPGSVAVNADDCFDDDGPAACGVDITGMAWEPVAGAPDLLQVTITFAGPLGGTEDFLLNMGIRGAESDGLGTNYSVEGGEASWNFPGSDGPLAGESASVDDNGRLVIIRDLSSLTGIIRISIRTRTLTDPQIGDAVQISNVADRG
jgi:hypothetical protein